MKTRQVSVSTVSLYMPSCSHHTHQVTPPTHACCSKPVPKVLLRLLGTLSKSDLILMWDVYYHNNNNCCVQWGLVDEYSTHVVKPQYSYVDAHRN